MGAAADHLAGLDGVEGKAGGMVLREAPTAPARGPVGGPWSAPGSPDVVPPLVSWTDAPISSPPVRTLDVAAEGL